MTRGWVVFLLAMVCCVLWGAAFPAIKIGYSLYGISSDNLSGQIIFAGSRFFLAGVLAWIIGSITYKKPLLPGKTSWGYVVVLGIFQTFLQYFFFYVGLAHTTGVKSSIIEGTSAFVSLMVAACIFRTEHLSPKKLLGCVLGFFGVLLVNLTGSGLGGGFSLPGEGFIFFSVVAYAFSSVCIKKFSRKELPFTLSAFQFMFGGLGLVIVGKIYQSVEPHTGLYMTRGFLSKTLSNPACALILLALAGISAIAYSLWGVLLKYNDVSRVSVFGFMTPVFGVILSALLLQEDSGLSVGMIILALVLVSVGTLIVQGEQGRSADAAAETDTASASEKA